MGNEWGTPRGLIEALADCTGLDFTVDLAASATNHKFQTYITAEEDALVTSWCALAQVTKGDLWLNPPYSRDLIGLFMKKAAETNARGVRVLALVRFDPSAQWFQDYVDGVAYEVLMLPRRVKFEGADSAYNFPICAVCYYGGMPRSTNYYIPTELTWEQ